MIDTDDIQKFQELAVSCKALNKNVNLYGIIRKMVKQYGNEVLLDAMNFFTEKLVMGEFRGKLLPAMAGFCKKASQYTAIGSDVYEPTSVTWVQDLDIAGLDSAVLDFTNRSGRAAQITENWSDKEIKQELKFLQIIRLEWAAIKKINKTRTESMKKKYWFSYKKSVRNMPIMLLQAQHETRIAEYKEKKDG